MTSTDFQLLGTKVGSSIDYGCCQSCHLVLKDPFIRCHECPVNTSKSAEPVYICLACFSKGREFPGHRNDHKYSVVKTDFSLFDYEWSAEEEMLLMNALLTQGHGNWAELAKSVPQKTADQCQLHFDKFYIENESSLLDNSWKDNSDTFTLQSRPVPYTINPAKVHEWPVRPPLGSHQWAGYNAARSDFDFEFDNLAEHDVANVEYHDLETNSSEEDPFPIVTLAALDVYTNKLKARLKRKKLIREYGLLSKGALLTLSRRYPSITNGGAKYEEIFRFGRLVCAIDFDFLLEGLSYEMELRQKILQLQECRKNGIKRLQCIGLYGKLRAQRENGLRQLSTLSETINDWSVTHPVQVQYICDKNTGQVLPVTGAKKPPIPLDIVGLPGFEKLTPDEKVLCSETRVVPEIYLEIKAAMKSECQRSNGLRLVEARTLVKIDVNKTRKIYDFLMRAGHIHLSPLI